MTWGTAKRQWIAVCWTVSPILTIYINAAWDTWWFGASLGHRGFEAAALFAMRGLAWWLTHGRERRAHLAATLVAVGCLIGWNLNLALLHMTWRDTLGSPVEYAVPYKDVLRVSVDYWGQFVRQ